MRSAILSLVLMLVVLLSGCAILSPEGGTIGAVQSLDDKIAAKYGVSQAAVDAARKALGIIDTRALPDSSRILPAGYAWTQDILDESNRVVNVEKFHWGAPYVIVAGPITQPNVKPGDVIGSPANTMDPSAQLLGIFEMLKNNPELLKQATHEAN